MRAQCTYALTCDILVKKKRREVKAEEEGWMGWDGREVEEDEMRWDEMRQYEVTRYYLKRWRWCFTWKSGIETRYRLRQYESMLGVTLCYAMRYSAVCVVWYDESTKTVKFGSLLHCSATLPQSAWIRLTVFWGQAIVCPSVFFFYCPKVFFFCIRRLVD